VAEGEQRAHGREDTVAGRRSERLERIPEPGEIAECDLRQRFSRPLAEPCGIGAVRSDSLRAPVVQPQFDEMVIGRRLKADYRPLGYQPGGYSTCFAHCVVF